MPLGAWPLVTYKLTDHYIICFFRDIDVYPFPAGSMLSVIILLFIFFNIYKMLLIRIKEKKILSYSSGTKCLKKQPCNVIKMRDERKSGKEKP